VNRVAFYTRISTDEQTQKYSLGAQKERLEAFCTSQYGSEWTLFNVYRDTESGTHLNRPGMHQMRADAQAQAFDTLLVFRVDRLSRKVKELALLVDELTKADVDLRSITEPFDTSNPAGKMMLQMLGVFAEFEHSTIIQLTPTILVLHLEHLIMPLRMCSSWLCRFLPGDWAERLSRISFAFEYFSTGTIGSCSPSKTCPCHLNFPT